MDNPKKANQGKFNRSKRKKEYFGKHKNQNNGKEGSKYNEEPRKELDSKTAAASSSSSEKKSYDSVQNKNSSTVKTNDASDTASKLESQPKVNFSNLKKETEEITNLTQKYCKRQIVSTWTRDFDIPETQEKDDNGANFEDLIAGSSKFFAGSHLILKEEKEWLKQSETSDSPFSLDLKYLEAGISCVPFYKRQGLSEKSFNPKEIQLMNDDAESSKVIYDKMKKEFCKKESLQKISLSNNSLNEQFNFCLKDDNNDGVIIKKENNSITRNVEQNVRNKNNESFLLNKNKETELVNDDEILIKNETLVRNDNESDRIDSFSLNKEKISNEIPCTSSSSAEISDFIPEIPVVSLEQRSGRGRRGNNNENNVKQNTRTNNVNNFVDVKTEVENDNSFSPLLQSKVDMNSIWNDKSNHIVDEKLEDSLKSKEFDCIKRDCDNTNVLTNNEKSRIKSEITNYSNTQTENKSVDIKELQKTEIKQSKIEIINKDDKSNENAIENVVTSNKSGTEEKEIVKNNQENILNKSSFKPLVNNSDDTDDLDFLLGLKEPSLNACNNLSTLSKVQEKLKGISITETKEVACTKKEDKNSLSLPGEDLDEWLDSVLGS